uniref:T9SS type A sorting domain-containing protein n=1 Tax=uncultured Planktosalinus sp. TaxID=1810935 RepID=UPI0030DDA5CA
VDAMIKHNSGINTAKVFWRESGTQNYQETAMSFEGDDLWVTELSVPGDATSIEYYIWAEANSGKTLTRPLVAPEGFWTFEISSLSAGDWAQQHIAGPYPNPASEKVSFNLNTISGEINITIHNVLGQKVYENTIENGHGKITLDLNPRWKGALFVTFSGEFGKVHKKVLKF